MLLNSISAKKMILVIASDMYASWLSVVSIERSKYIFSVSGVAVILFSYSF